MIMEIYSDVITRYLKMGAGQFLRDFRRDYHLKKSLAHRKSLISKKEKARKGRMKVHLAQIEQDRSERKRSSHIRLLALINEVKEDVGTLYKKAELQHLCDAYKVKYYKSWNKDQLAKALTQAIPTYDHIPHHQITSTYAIQATEFDAPDQIPVLRLRRL